MKYDRHHHEIAVKLLESLPSPLKSIAATKQQDIDGIDRIIVRENGDYVPMGLKRRGAGSGDDFNLTAWSAVKGNLPEFANAGEKLYLYWMKNRHVLVQHPLQKILDALLPEKWSPITNGGRWKWINAHCGVRLESEASSVQQGVVFVPHNLVTIIAEWDMNLNLIRTI